jgi:predicted nuclease with TOPRIM domain
MYFFKEGKNIDIDTPPGCLLTKEMEEAMSVLKKFSEKELEYDIYQNRLRAIRVQKSLEQERDEAVQKLDDAEQKLDDAEQKLDDAEQKLDKLSKALKDVGIDPEDVLKK